MRLLISLVVVLGSSVYSRAADVPKVEQIETTALRARQQIRAMSASLQVRITATAEANEPSGEKRWNLWWEGPERNRGDLTRSHLPPQGVRLIHGVGCERAGWGLTLEDRTNVCAPLRPVAELKDSMYATTDPRYFGYTNEPTSTYRGIAHCLIGRTDRTAPTVEQVQRGGHTCYRVKWQRNTKDLDMEMVFDPDQGGNPVLIDASYPLPGGKKGRETSEVELVQVGPEKVWYPRVVRYERKSDDQVLLSETITFSQVTINEPIAAEVFKLKGMNLQEGQLLCLPANDPLGPIAEWKDGRLQKRVDEKPRKFDSLEPAAKPVSEGGGVNYWLVGVCVACSLAAVAVVVLWRRAKKV